MPSDSAILDRIHDLALKQGSDTGRIDTLEDDRGHMWNSIGKLEDMVGNIRVDVAKIVVLSTMIQTALTGGLLYLFTKGH